MTPLEQAEALLQMSPLPDDAEAKLEKLAQEAGEMYAIEFSMLTEALFVARQFGE